MSARSAHSTAARPNRLPGSEELFRRTSPADAAAAGGGLAGAPAPTDEPVAPPLAIHAVDTRSADTRPVDTRPVEPASESAPDRRPTGRERHDEKITVYVSNDELIDLEHARLTLKRLGVKADRGRIVREALAELIGDLERHGEQAVLVRRLRTE